MMPLISFRPSALKYLVVALKWHLTLLRFSSDDEMEPTYTPGYLLWMFPAFIETAFFPSLLYPMNRYYSNHYCRPASSSCSHPACGFSLLTQANLSLKKPGEREAMWPKDSGGRGPAAVCWHSCCNTLISIFW